MELAAGEASEGRISARQTWSQQNLGTGAFQRRMLRATLRKLREELRASGVQDMSAGKDLPPTCDVLKRLCPRTEAVDVKQSETGSRRRKPGQPNVKPSRQPASPPRFSFLAAPVQGKRGPRRGILAL